MSEIIALAREAGFYVNDELEVTSPFVEDYCILPLLKSFYNLVAAKERENWPAEMKAMENQVNILTDELSKATEEANARANASWTLMCKKMVDIEREACAKDAEWCIQNHLEHLMPERIRARKETV